jgi:hypothetical protein
MKMMFLAKLKTVIGTSVVAVALGIGGLIYNAELVPAGAQAADEAKPKSELEMLRKENELLKMNLRVTLEKIISQDEELKTFKRQGAAVERINARDAALTKIYTGLSGKGFGQPAKGNEKPIDQNSIKADEVAQSLSGLMKEGKVQQIDLAVKASAALKQWMEAKDKESRAKILQEMELLIAMLKAGEQQEDSKGAVGK